MDKFLAGAEGTDHNEVQSAVPPRVSNQNSSLITIQGRLTLCQILGEFKTLESPVSLFNKFEALVLRYHLNIEDACSLPKAWLPGPQAVQLSSQVIDNLADEEEQMRELQCILDCRVGQSYE